MGRVRLSKDARKEQLLAAALRAFVRSGYHSTQVADIIEEADVARGTFYLHFESKHAIFSELVERMMVILMDMVPTVRDEDLASTTAFTRHLHDVYLGVFTSLRRHRRLAALFFEEAVGIDKGFAKRLDRYYDAWRDRVAALIASLEEAGLAAPTVEPELLADLIVGSLDHITRRLVIRRRTPDLDGLVAGLVSFQLTAMAVLPD